MFAHSDDNYTQGISLEIVNSIFRKNPVNYLFFKSKNKSQYGISLEHLTFTPDVISSKEIQYGNRPFAATLYLKSFKITDNLQRKERLYSSFLMGVIGPRAYGKEGQTLIHEATDNWIPYGWRNQLGNDVLINYELNHEKQLLNFKDLLFLNSDLGLRLGSMYTDVSVGSSLMLGLFKSPLSINANKGKFQIYLYSNPKVYIVGYDATLQGGLFNSNNLYTIGSSDITRLKAKMDYGIVIKSGFFYLEYTRSQITKEFKTGKTEGWGGLRLGFRI
nr:lipid A deacylase LpxR family protein [Gramella sp. MAR_2010_147]